MHARFRVATETLRIREGSLLFAANVDSLSEQSLRFAIGSDRHLGRRVSAPQVPWCLTRSQWPGRPSRSMRVHAYELGLAVAAVACTPNYAYEPASNATATMGGRDAADYPVPPEQPHGDVRIASFGFADLTPGGVPDDEAHALHALHLRMVIANNDDHDWTLDTREQRLELPERGKSAPAFAAADPGTPPPTITIPLGGKRVVDLFFPLPSDQQHAGTIPSFDAIWTVHMAARTVTERTPFDRIVVAPAATEFDYGPDFWAAPYWYDPGYPGVAFVGVAPLGPVYFGAPIVVHVHGGSRRHWR
jgi:hypothetical protein